jgi:hypothetical protein
MALNPGNDIPALKFPPCASARPGCKQAHADWAEPPMVSTFGFRKEPVRQIGNELFLSYGRSYSDAFYLPERAGIAVIESVTANSTRAAIGDYDWDGACVGHFLPGGGSVSAVLVSNAPDTQFIGSAPIATPTSLALTTVSVAALGSGSGGASQVVSHGDAYLYVAMSSPFSVTIWDISNTKPIVPNQPKRIPAEFPTAVKDGALALDNDTTGLWFIRPDGSYLKLLAPIGQQILFDVEVDRASGEQIVWLEGDQPQFDYINVAIWTAPYTTNPSTVQRRKVALIGTSSGWMVVNAGMVLTLQTKNTARLTRLSDGVGWIVQAEPGERFLQPLWIDDQEVWLGTGTDYETSDSYMTGILRLARSSLGSPTLDAGL